MTPPDRIIVPLDVPTRGQALARLDGLPDVNFWKVGLELFVNVGPAILEELHQRQKRIFLDLKLHDIPNTVAGAVAAAHRHRVDLLTVHATAGRAALAAARAATGADQNPKLLAITLLTSLGDRDLAADLQIPGDLPDYVLHLARLAQATGCAGAVCSPQEVARLRQACGPDFVLVCPGVRPSWAATDDQQRVATPLEALRAGADYLVIGRPLTQARDPGVAWQRLLAELAAA